MQPIALSVHRALPPKPTNASETYQKLSQLEHILKDPILISDLLKTKTEMWCFDAETESMVFKEVTIVLGCIKSLMKF